MTYSEIAFSSSDLITMIANKTLPVDDLSSHFDSSCGHA
jgi:hypothetical protein